MIAHNHFRGLLGILAPAVREKILALADERNFAAGESIFREGDPSTCLCTVETGRVSLTMSSPPRGSRTLMTLGPGDLFSWSAMVEPYRETCTARAFEDSTIVQIPADKLIALCRSDHEVGFEVYRAMAVVLASRVRALQMQLADVFAPA